MLSNNRGKAKGEKKKQQQIKKKWPQVTRENVRAHGIQRREESEKNNNGNEWVVTLIKKNWLQFTSRSVTVVVIVCFSLVCVALVERGSRALDMIFWFGSY